MSARAEMVASIAVEPATILWGWSELLRRNNTGDDGIANSLRAFGEHQGLTEFTTEEVPYDAGGREPREAIADLAHDLGHATIEVLGPEYHYYSLPSGSAGSRGVLALSEWSVEPPRPTMIHTFTTMARMLDLSDDVGWSLEGLARLQPGWSCARLEDAAPGTPVWRLANAEGEWMRIETEFDQQGRLIRTQVQGINAPDANGATDSDPA